MFQNKIFYFLIIMLLFRGSGYSQAQVDIYDELQTNDWYLPTADGETRLYITQLGQGDMVIALHGGPGNNHMYLADAVRTQAAQQTFVLYDQRGSILSPVADSLTGGLTVDKLVADLESLRQALGQDQIVLFGHSFGTLLAMQYYIKFPQHVKGLILTATMPPYIAENTTLIETFKGVHERIRELRQRPEVNQVLSEEGMLEDSVLSARQRSDKYKITGLAAYNMIDLKHWRRFKGGRVFYNPLVDGAIASSLSERYDIRPAMKENPVPITVIQGDQDYIDPGAGIYWNELLKEYNQVHRIVIPQSGHYIWLDHPEAFDRALRQALDRYK